MKFRAPAAALAIVLVSAVAEPAPVEVDAVGGDFGCVYAQLGQ